MLATLHSLFALCILFNTITVILYWTLLHEVTLIRHQDNLGRTLHTYISHSFPAISMLLLWWVNEIRLHVGHWKGINVIGVAYALWNYIKFKRTGLVLYHFLNWNEASAVINMVLIMVVFSLVYVLIAKASYWLKPLERHAKTK